MKLIRRLVLFTMCNNILFKAVHLDGVHNEIADALSRFQHDRFVFGPTGKSSSSRNSIKVFEDNFRAKVNQLLVSSLAPSTMKLYQRGFDFVMDLEELLAWLTYGQSLYWI